MTAHDPTFIKDGNNVNANQLIIELRDKLPCAVTAKKWAVEEGNSVISTTSTSFVLARSFAITCEPDEVVFFKASMNVSANTLGLGAALQLRLDAAPYQIIGTAVGSNVSSLGTQGHVQAEWMFRDLSGTKTFGLYWAVFNGTGTIYSANQYLLMKRFKYRSADIDGG